MSSVHASIAEPFQPEAIAGNAVPETPANSGEPALVTKRQSANLNVGEMITVAAQRCGKTPVQMMCEFAKLAFGPGKLSFEEYFALGVHDHKGGPLDAMAFVGLKGAREIWRTMNFDQTWTGVTDDKLAADAMFRGLGFAVPNTVAVYSTKKKLPAYKVLNSAESLAAFLQQPSNYPLFGKPNDSLQSLGSASLASYDAATNSLVTTQGETIALDAFVTEILENYSAGYLFQARLKPHPEVRAMCGNRAATVRVMTVMRKTGPEVLGALWKIPAGLNAADNFWRQGNLLAQLDLETGRVRRVVCGAGLDAQEVEAHPDTGAKLIGMQVPDWRKLIDVALDAHRFLSNIGLIGWDIAPCETGPVIVEPNCTPDFALPQIAERRGALDDRLKALIAEKKAESQVVAKRNVQAHTDERTRESKRLNLKLSARRG